MPLLGLEKVKEAIDDIKKDVNDSIRGVYVGGLSNVIQRTPADKGEARNGWVLSVNAPSQSTASSKSVGGNASFRQLAQLPLWVLDKAIYYTNNTEHIGVLEYGGFPSPVKQGSYIKKTKSYQILSVNGFSKQAPSGFVRKSLIEMENKIRSL